MKFSLLIFVVFICIKNSIQENVYSYNEFEDVPLDVNALNKSNVPTTRIFGGKPAAPKQFPYQVKLYLYLHERVKGSNDVSSCGGTLISNQYILTAAHCLYITGTKQMGYSLDVLLGAVNRSNPFEEGQKRVIVPSNSSFIIHSQYNFVNFANDIALVKLPYRVQFNDYIKPAKLPLFKLKNKNLVGKSLIASGWGNLNDFGDKRVDILQYTGLTIVDDNDCSHYPNYDGQRQICMKSPGRSICHGDSGGPNVIMDSNRPVVVGITSFGHPKGCTLGYPDVFTRVSYYVEWIIDNINRLSFQL